VYRSTKPPQQHTRHYFRQLSGGGADSTVLKLSIAGTGEDFIFVGDTAGNGSSFVANGATAGGVLLDYGMLYASAVLDDTKHSRQLLWGWVMASYAFPSGSDPQWAALQNPSTSLH